MKSAVELELVLKGPDGKEPQAQDGAARRHLPGQRRCRWLPPEGPAGTVRVTAVYADGSVTGPVSDPGIQGRARKKSSWE